jgi:hypothetical protein
MLRCEDVKMLSLVKLLSYKENVKSSIKKKRFSVLVVEDI